MSLTPTRPGTSPQHGQQTGSATSSIAKHHPNRWRLSRAGIVNVWHYHNVTFELTGGRMILRGTNGSGKSRALEMLLPYLLDADRRRMDATGSGKVQLKGLMEAGHAQPGTRIGYLWLELARRRDPDVPAADGAPVDDVESGGGDALEYLTVGAQIRFSPSAATAKPTYFTTPQRVGTDLDLLKDGVVLSRDELGTLVGADRLSESPERHRERVAAAVFGLTGDAGQERYNGLLSLLHTLRAPDVGNRIEEGRLPQILSDALPPLGDGALTVAGTQLTDLTTAREQQEQITETRKLLEDFCSRYRRYLAAQVGLHADNLDRDVTALEKATKAAATTKQEQAQAEEKHAAAKAEHGELAETVAELEATVQAIRDSPAYRSLGDLRELRELVKSRRDTASATHEHAAAARRAEERAADAVNGHVGQVSVTADAASATLRQASEALVTVSATHDLPADLRYTRHDPDVEMDHVRLDLEGDTSPVERPDATRITVTPAGGDPAVSAALDTAEAVLADRTRTAQERLGTAKELDSEGARVNEAETKAQERDSEAATADAEAAEITEDLEQKVSAYVTSWRDWADHPDTRRLLGTPDWSATPVGPLLDGAGVHADHLTSSLLGELDRAAATAARPALDELATRRAVLDQEERASRAETDELDVEERELRAERDPAPDLPAWQAATAGVPLWRALDFHDEVPEQDRAGIEGALTAAGLLTATVTPTGVLATGGQLLIDPTGPRAPEPVTAVLRASSDDTDEASLLTAILERIHLGVTDAHATWVTTAGQWRNGPATGAHHAGQARYIGAAARQANRERRLAEITERLTALRHDADQRDIERAGLHDFAAELDRHVRTAPASTPIVRAHTRAENARASAEKARAAARAAQAEAAKRRHDWRAACGRHADLCRHADLPSDTASLEGTVTLTLEGSGHLRDLRGKLQLLATTWTSYEAAVATLAEARNSRRAAEQSAADAWRGWDAGTTRLAALESNVGLDAREAAANLDAAERELRERTRERDVVRDTLEPLAAQRENAKSAAEQAARERVATEDALAATFETVREVLALPGLLPALGDDAPVTLTVPERVDVASARQLTGAMRSATSGIAALSVDALDKATDQLSGDLTGVADVSRFTRTAGIRLIEVDDGEGSQPVALAAAAFAHRETEALTRLTTREQQVFQEYILGGLVEELRRRIAQANILIDAMSASLSQITTSNGIGVKVKWELSDSTDTATRRIRDLVQVADQVRTTEQTSELVDLLKARVDQYAAADPEAGYVAHLTAALDYRTWHMVNVIITGPAPGQERRISRRARLSQGETRFVSYVTLFAAVDAYLSSLDGTSLRMLLLDDAFAKVDDPTVAELMGLLVHLDIDFVMTGHGLWGCFPSVPSIDTYEVRRREGTWAATVRTHWDGKTRHLRVAT